MNKELKTKINNLSAKELQEVIDLCNKNLANIETIKDYILSIIKKYNKKENVSNCKYVMLGGFYSGIDDHYVGEMYFREIGEYEGWLNDIYEEKFKNDYLLEDFCSIDLTTQLYKFMNSEKIKDFYDKLEKCKGYPCDEKELWDADGGFGVIWCYDIEKDNIFTIDIDLH